MSAVLEKIVADRKQTQLKFAHRFALGEDVTDAELVSAAIDPTTPFFAALVKNQKRIVRAHEIAPQIEALKAKMGPLFQAVLKAQAAVAAALKSRHTSEADRDELVAEHHRASLAHDEVRHDLRFLNMEMDEIRLAVKAFNNQHSLICT
jgi:hypothetical protein